MSLSSIRAEDLRQMVRSILREVLPVVTQTGPTKERIAITSDDDLSRFVIHLLGLFENPAKREAIRSGVLSFTISDQNISVPAQAVSGDATQLSGVISERKLLSFAKAGDSVAISAGAVVTPLARDKARALNITLIRRG